MADKRMTYGEGPLFGTFKYAVKEEDKYCSVAYSPDGKFVAYAIYRTIVICDGKDLHDFQRIVAHDCQINKIRFSYDSTKLISCGNDCTVRVWEFQPDRNRFLMRWGS